MTDEQSPDEVGGRVLAELDGVEVHAESGDRAHPYILLRGVSLAVRSGEIVGLIGETGAGKSMTAWAFTDLLPRGAALVAGTVTINGSVISGDPKAAGKVRGTAVSMIGQNPRAAFHPLIPIGRQIANAYRAHHRVSRTEAEARAHHMLEQVRIVNPAARMKAYPHELSGGMAQRALIALAMVNDPAVLVADEPTTGLDSHTQVDVLNLIADLVRDAQSAAVIVSHDLAVISRVATTIAVMFAGQIVETGPAQQVLSDPRHPYTRGLVRAVTGDLGSGPTDLGGDPPRLQKRPCGCQFAYRCLLVEEACQTTDIPLIPRRRPTSDPKPAAGATQLHRLRCRVVDRHDAQQEEQA